jgi:molybdopterin biosynthesis enzyme
MIEWYYYKAKIDGYAVNANYFKNATKEKPASLEVGTLPEIKGLQAVPVRKGDRLPMGCNGIVSKKDVDEGKRVKLEGNTLKIFQAIQIKEAKGFKYRDTYMHKGVETNPWSGAWNLAMVISLGLALGFMAEGFTDMLGFKITKIKHYEGAH